MRCQSEIPRLAGNDPAKDEGIVDAPAECSLHLSDHSRTMHWTRLRDGQNRLSMGDDGRNDNRAPRGDLASESAIRITNRES